MTKMEMFNHIATINADNEEIVAFCEHEIELLKSKRGSGSKPTKTQLENERYKLAMVATMTNLDRPVTISELMEICEAIGGLKNQRVSALMTQLKNSGKVVRTTDRKKAFFALVSEDEGSEGGDE